jgi:Flp pilus assembly protein CpaB
MNRRMWVSALCAGVAGALCLHFYLARLEDELAGGAPQRIVVITRDLALGETLTRSALSLRVQPERYVEERHVQASDMDRVVGARLTGVLHSGSALLWSDLDVMQDGRTLAGLVRAGMRAYTLGTSDTSFDGLLRPGDRADVLFTAAEGADALVVLENVLILTVGGDLGDEQTREVKHVRGAHVTVSVTSEQAALLSRYQQRGSLRLLLRNPQDLLVMQRAPAPSVADESAAEVRRGR